MSKSRMMRSQWPLAVFLFVMASTAQAATFRFDPNDLLGLYPAEAGVQDLAGETKSTQMNARRVHQVYASTWYETFYDPSGPNPQPDDYNTYLNWLDGLQGPREGISSFNIWLLSNPRARSWGEKMVWNPSGAVPTATADPSNGWNAEVIDNPYDPGTGWLVQWYTTDPASMLRPNGSDIQAFSFSGAAFWDTDENGYDPGDPLVQAGEEARIWVGALNDTEWTDSGWKYSWSTHFDDADWGSRTPASSAPFSAGLIGEEGYGSGWEGALNVEAVPIPGAVWLLGSGLIGLFGVRRKLGRS